MCKKVLFYAFTPFEIISAIAIKGEYFANDMVDIIIDDSIQNQVQLQANINSAHVFNNAIIAERSQYFGKYNNRIKHEFYRIKATLDSTFFAKYIDNLDSAYDVFVTTEIDYFTDSIYSYLRKRNAKLDVILMDEGYSSYTYYFREKVAPQYLKNKVKNFFFYGIGRIYGRHFIAKEAKRIFLFRPELMCWKDNVYKIMPIEIHDTEKLIEEINAAFDYDNKLIKDYRNKYIYFEESFFWSNRNSNDLRIINKIADIVGKENITIKLHPRNKINRFDNLGYTVQQSVGLPWELFAINMNAGDDKVFITFSSGAVLNYKFLTDKSYKTVLLYKCMSNEYYKVDSLLMEWFEKFRKLYPDSLFIPENEDELCNVFKELNY